MQQSPTQRQEFFIQWEETQLENLSEHDQSAHLFLIVIGRKAMYVGFTFEMNLKDEVLNTMNNLKINESEFHIWTGKIVENTHNAINRLVAEECMCLLIYEHQSVLNSICLAQYHGRKSLKIHNRGCALLKECVSTLFCIFRKA